MSKDIKGFTMSCDSLNRIDYVKFTITSVSYIFEIGFSCKLISFRLNIYFSSTIVLKLEMRMCNSTRLFHTRRLSLTPFILVFKEGIDVGVSIIFKGLETIVLILKW